MLSPRHTTTRMSAGDAASAASRKYQDVVLFGNAPSSSSPPTAPASGAVT